MSASNGTLSGSFTVRNVGRARAGRSSAALVVRVSRKRRVLKRFAVSSVKRSKSRTVDVSSKIPAGLPAGTLTLRACADGRGRVRESKEANNCRRVGTLTVAGPKGPTPPKSSRPTNPVSFNKDNVFTLNFPFGGAQSKYWIYVPSSYDASHATPMTLFVWSHGCGGFSSGDIFTVSPGGNQSWISITLDGREGGCWNMGTDPGRVMAAVANVKTHFNVNPRRVILGGYSSGGDLSYRTAFYNAKSFAGVLAENTSPFRDTGSTQAQSLAAAAWKFNVVHLAHTGDTVYPIAGVRNETDAMKAAGFPMTRIERPGSHYDDSPEGGTTGTDYDLRTLLLPHLNDGWLSP